MPAHALDHGLKIFSTCPPCALAQPRMYFRQVQEIARWSEDAGCEGILVYTDNAQVDPWLVSQVIIEATGRLCPLVEYTTIIQSLLRTAGPVSFEGRYYKVTNLKLTPPLPADLLPGVLLSGSP